MYCQFLREKGIKPTEDHKWGFPVLNIKVVKLMMFRA